MSHLAPHLSCLFAITTYLVALSHNTDSKYIHTVCGTAGFLPRDARSAQRRTAVVRPSVGLSLTLMYPGHTRLVGLSEITRIISLRSYLPRAPTSAIVQREPQILGRIVVGDLLSSSFTYLFTHRQRNVT